MRSELTASGITRGHRNLLLVATVFTALLVTMGAVVCATESGAACPDWPGCFGRAIPPPQIHSIIEYTHRLIAALTTPLIIAAAVVGWRRARNNVLVTRLPLIAIFFTLAVVVFGAFAVLTGLARGVAALDLGSALIVLTLMTTATTAAFARRDRPEPAGPAVDGVAVGRARRSDASDVYAVYVGGILVAGKGSLTRCLSWPIWRILPGRRTRRGPRLRAWSYRSSRRCWWSCWSSRGWKSRGLRGVRRAALVAGWHLPSRCSWDWR